MNTKYLMMRADRDEVERKIENHNWLREMGVTPLDNRRLVRAMVRVGEVAREVFGPNPPTLYNKVV